MRRARLGFWTRLAIAIVKPPTTLLTRSRWAGQERIPSFGPVIIAINHISYLDPFPLAHFRYAGGRIPRFLAKQEFSTLPVGGRIVRGAWQIPVPRSSERAEDALGAAAAALGRGECAVSHPQGCTTTDPAYWPMRAGTGLARLALLTATPVVPAGQWGAQRILGRDGRPHLLPPRVVAFSAGPPIDRSQHPAGGEHSGWVLHEVTDLIAARIRGLVHGLRAETPPATAFDPRRLLPVVDPVRRIA